jgi:hypothetical protein
MITLKIHLDDFVRLHDATSTVQSLTARFFRSWEMSLWFSILFLLSLTLYYYTLLIDYTV